MRIIVIHASRDGQTARIAARMGATLAARRNDVTVLPYDAHGIAAEIERADLVIVGGGIRYGKHPPGLERFVRRNFALLVSRPNAFFSVSLSAGGPGARPEAAARNLQAFLDRTAWTPDRTACIAGALRYSHYNIMIRLLMRMIVGAAGGDTDPSRDYEYTDWEGVDAFALQCAAGADSATAARLAAD